MLLPLKFLTATLLAAITTSGEQQPPVNDKRRVVPPPVLLPIESEVLEGQQVAITVSCTPRVDRSAKILLRSQPEHGSIVGLEQVDRTTALVIYQHDGQSSAAYDTFTVAAQSPNSPVSAAARVTVAIRQRPPRFVAPEVLDFGEIHSQELIKRTLVLQNTGGGVVAGTMEVPQPWQALDGNEFRINAGHPHRITLVMKPDSFRDYSDVIRYTVPGAKPTRLQARVVAPFSVTPGNLVFPYAEETNSQSLTITNNTRGSLNLGLISPGWVELPESLQIPAAQEIEVAVGMRDDRESGRTGIVLLATGGYEQAVDLISQAAPARVIVQPARLDFGEVEPADSAFIRLSLSNQGGSNAQVAFSVPDELTIDGGVTSVAITAASEQEIVVRLQEVKGNELNDTLELTWEGGELSVPVTARRKQQATSIITQPVEPRPPMETARSTPAPAPSPFQPESIGPRIYAPDQFAERRDDELPPPGPVAVNFAGQRSAEISWPRQTEGMKYFTEIRGVLNGEDGLPALHWVEFTDAQYRVDEGRYVATLNNLVPGRKYRFRISTSTMAGALSLPREVPIFQTQAAAKATFPVKWLLAVLAVTLVGIVGWRRFRQTKSNW